MYPDNYMNPMNNPMTNPNYGYNRMQQVQQMQRAINPQLKETAFNLAKTQGIDPKQIMGVLSNFGIKI